MNKHIILLYFLLLLSPLAMKAQETFVYAVRGTDTLCLDVYRPSQPREDRAVVVYLHGGGFVAGSRSDSLCQVSCSLLALRGYTVLSVDYRLVSRNLLLDTIPLTHMTVHAIRAFQEAVEDGSAAVAFLCQHAKDWDVDTSKIILTGSSAGAVTILNMDYCRANGSNWVRELPEGIRFAAVIPYSGAIYSNKRPFYKSSPSPTCFFHGTKDRLVNYDKVALGRHHLTGSNKLAAMLLKNDWCYSLYRIEGHAHEVAYFLPQTLEEFDAFVAQVLAGRKVQYETSCYNVPFTFFDHRTVLQMLKK